MNIKKFFNKLIARHPNMQLGAMSGEPIQSGGLSQQMSEQELIQSRKELLQDLKRMSNRIKKLEAELEKEKDKTLKDNINGEIPDDGTEKFKTILNDLVKNVFKKYGSTDQLNKKAEDFESQLNYFIQKMSKKEEYSRELAEFQARITNLEEKSQDLTGDKSSTLSDNEPGVDGITSNDATEEFTNMLDAISNIIGDFVKSDVTSTLDARTKMEELFNQREKALAEQCKEKYAAKFSSLQTDKMPNSEIIAYAEFFNRIEKITESLITDIQQIQDEEQNDLEELDKRMQNSLSSENLDYLQECKDRIKCGYNFSSLDRTLATEGEILAILQIILEANPEMNTEMYQVIIHDRFMKNLTLRKQYEEKYGFFMSPFYEKKYDHGNTGAKFVVNPLIYYYCKTIVDFIDWNEILNKNERLRYYYRQSLDQSLNPERIKELKETNIAGVITSLLEENSYKDYTPHQKPEKSVNKLVLEQLKKHYGFQAEQLNNFVSKVFEDLDDKRNSFVDR